MSTPLAIHVIHLVLLVLFGAVFNGRLFSSSYLQHRCISGCTFLVSPLQLCCGPTAILLIDAFCKKILLIAQNIHYCRRMLATFYQLIPQLYPQELCTANVHSLIHLCDFVKDWGPLWTFSCFQFENLNGYIRNHCHGTRNVLPQFAHTIRLRHILPLLHRKLEAEESEASASFLEKVNGSKIPTSEGVLGRITSRKLSNEDTRAIREANYSFRTSTVPVFPRYKLQCSVYHSREKAHTEHTRQFKYAKFDTVN